MRLVVWWDSFYQGDNGKCLNYDLYGLPDNQKFLSREN